jgi:hypothetical protein
MFYDGVLYALSISSKIGITTNNGNNPKKIPQKWLEF